MFNYGGYQSGEAFMNAQSGVKAKILECADRLERAMPIQPTHLIHKSPDGNFAVADQAVAGIVNFACHTQTPTPVGRKAIDWSGKHHPHQEWPAQLNRFFFLVPLAQAYKATGDERYAEAARDYIADWLRAHPTREGWAQASYDNTLNLCIRVGNLGRSGWMGTLPDFLKSPHFDDVFVQAMLESIRVQLAFEMAHMPSGMNWRIAASDCLLAAGLKLGFLPEAAVWRAFGVKCLNDAWHRQVLPSGAHAERNPGYHVWMTQVMTSFSNLGRSMPELGLIMDPARVGKMWDYALTCTRPNGELNALHDCAGERAGAWSDTRAGAGIRREREAFLRAWKMPDANPPTHYFHPDTGQALLRTGWTEDDVYVTFDATVWGGGHCHLSRNAIQLHAFRQSMLVDPGTLTYEGSDPFMAHGKSTRAHNTCTLNNLNQSATNPQDVGLLTGPGYAVVQGTYEGGYWDSEYQWGFSHLGKGIWASHRRWVLWIQDLGLVVVDDMRRLPVVPWGKNEEPPSLECNWQLAESAELELAPDGSRADVRFGDCGLAMLFAHRPDGAKLGVFKGTREPLRGWLASGQGVIPAPQLVQRLPRMERQQERLLTVLIPWGNGKPLQPVNASVQSGNGCDRLVLSWADGRTDEVHWTDALETMLGAQPGYDTDASLAHLRKDAAGRVVKACAAGGTYLKPFLGDVLPAPCMLVWETGK